jgi:hypothetical protein
MPCLMGPAIAHAMYDGAGDAITPYSNNKQTGNRPRARAPDRATAHADFVPDQPPAPPPPAPSSGQRSASQGAAEKIKRENDVHLRQLAKKSTYVPIFFFF